MFTALRRLQEEDPTIDLHRDAQTGEQIVAGLSQVHVEVIVGRMKDRFGAEVELKPPRVPYQETIRKPAKAHGRHKKQTRRARPVRRLPHRDRAAAPTARVRVREQDQGRRDPRRFIPAVEKGVHEAMEHGAVAGYPVKGVQGAGVRRLSTTRSTPRRWRSSWPARRP